MGFAHPPFNNLYIIKFLPFQLPSQQRIDGFFNLHNIYINQQKKTLVF